jgi:hypothetical protein
VGGLPIDRGHVGVVVAGSGRRARGVEAVELCGGEPEWETSPNFMAIFTWSRCPLIASPTISSLRNGP